jgi:hypothetical protein
VNNTGICPLHFATNTILFCHHRVAYQPRASPSYGADGSASQASCAGYLDLQYLKQINNVLRQCNMWYHQNEIIAVTE